MRPRGGPARRSLTPALVTGLLVLLAAAPLLANGGTLRVADEPVGGYRVSVYTSPTPPRPDSLDVSVLVVRAGDPEPVPGLSIVVHVAPEPDPAGPTGARTWIVAATRAQATDPRYYSAVLAPGAEGRWNVQVEVRGPDGEGAVTFPLVVRERGALQNPWVITVLALIPLGALAWWLFRMEEEGIEQRERSPGNGEPHATP